MMDTSDLAAAALRPDGRGRCNCARSTKNGKPWKRCEKCRGTGILTACLDCQGSGWSAKTNAICHQCGGQGYRTTMKDAQGAINV